MHQLNPVVVIPTHKKHEDAFARISLAHLFKFLGQFRLVLAMPESLDWKVDGLEAEKFPDTCFGTLTRYNQFKLSLDFYERFAGHSHILIYHFDALVFQDNLLEWCSRPFDYIGAVWYPELIKKYANFDWPYVPIGCGNGGLSLRRTSAFIKHLKNRSSIQQVLLKQLFHGQVRDASLVWKYRKHLNPSQYLQHESLNEDVYFGVFAPLFDSGFRVATPEEGNLFSFEYCPNFLFEANGGKIPFGCHAWHRFSDALDFWKPHLLLQDEIDGLGVSP